MDFQEKAEVVRDEFRYLDEHKLQRRVESPVFVFDLTPTTGPESVWTPFLASIHWARGQVAPEALRNVLRLGARVPALG